MGMAAVAPPRGVFATHRPARITPYLKEKFPFVIEVWSIVCRCGRKQSIPVRAPVSALVEPTLATGGRANS